MFRGNVNRDDIVAAMSQEVSQSDVAAEEEEEASLELPSEVPFEFGQLRRSRGTVQHDWHLWKQHRAEYSDSHYTLAIAAYHRWDRNVQPSPLAVVIRLEEKGHSVPVYALQQQAIAEMRAAAHG